MGRDLDLAKRLVTRACFEVGPDVLLGQSPYSMTI
jgi:hypothetical protein